MTQNNRTIQNISNTQHNPDTLSGKLAALGDQMGWCDRCTYPGPVRPRHLDIGVTYVCVGCGARWSIDFDAAEAAPGVLRTHPTPAA